MDDQGGFANDRQRIILEERARDRCLVEVVKTIGNWQMAPEQYGEVTVITGRMCTGYLPIAQKARSVLYFYKIYYNVDGSISDEILTSILPITGGLFVQAKNVPRTSFIQLHVECSGNSWTSNFETTDSLGLHLHED